MRIAMIVSAALLAAACHPRGDADGAADAAVVDFHPVAPDATPPPVRVIDNSVIRELAAGKTEGVYLYDMRRVGIAMRPEVAAERAEDLACRIGGDPTDTAAACRRRDDLIAELKRKGLCWGPDTEVPADKRWMRTGVGCRG